MATRRWLYALGAALVVNLVLSLWGWLDELTKFFAGRHDLQSSLAVSGLITMAVIAVAGVGTARSSMVARREIDRRGDFIEAVGTMSRDWLWETNRSGRIVYSSDGIQDLLGYSPEEVLGMFSHDLLFDDHIRAEVADLQETTGWDDVRVAWRHRDGHAVTLVGTAVAIRDHDDRVIGHRGARSALAPSEALSLALTGADERITTVLANGGLEVALQPLLSITTGRITGVEALARFSDGRGPESWFQDAHRCGRTLELDAHAFSAALSLFDEIPDPVCLSVNAGPDLLMDPGFHARLVGSALPLHRLVIEVTEHAHVPDYEALNAAIDPLRERGVRFAIDDTGAGYASLNHVLQLRPDVIKLDRALITHLNDDRARRSLVTALVLLALDLGASVTGEGVETLGQLETLSTLGVDQAQGYVVARPTLDRAEWQQWWEGQWMPAQPYDVPGSIPEDKTSTTP